MTNPLPPNPERPPLTTEDVAEPEAPHDAQPHESWAPRPAATESAEQTEGLRDRSQLDEGTYDRLVEPRSANRLVLAEGTWHQISRKYLWVQLISSGFFLLVTVAIALVVTFVLDQTWALIPGGLATLALVWGMAILPRQVRAIGYQLRDDDLVFRRGIIWQRMIAVPYGRMQLVDISHGPLDRGFGIAQLKFVTAAASTGVTIPGLPQSTAEALRDHLVEVAESRRTGL